MINTDMRIFEIIEPINPEKFKPKPSKQRGFDVSGSEKVGGGLFARAVSSSIEPGTVRKIVDSRPIGDLKNDAYFKYVQLLAKNNRFIKNSYFPKIYDVQVRTYKEEGIEETYYTYAVDMERLYDWSTLRDEEALMLGKRMFYNYEKLSKHFLEKASEYNDIVPQYRIALLEFIRHAVFDIWGEYPKDVTDQRTTIKDTDLKKAVMLLKSLKAKEGVGFDIHSGNIMIRRTSTGPQLVFTDPVA